MIPAEAPRRLVVRMPNWLGDAVMALPALGALRAEWPDTDVTLAASPAVAPVFEERTPAAPQHILRLDKAGERAALAAGAFDAILLLTNSFRTAWTASRAGIPERWGYQASGRALLLTRTVGRPLAW